jgi:phosphoribosylformylglycinamidine synthase
VLACHDLSEGGLAVAAAEMAFGGGVGAELDLARLPVRGAPDVARRLFGQSASRFLLEVEPAQIPALHALLKDLPHARLGRTAAHAELVVTDGGRPVLREPLAALRAAWLAPLDLDHEHGAETAR